MATKKETKPVEEIKLAEDNKVVETETAEALEVEAAKPVEAEEPVEVEVKVEEDKVVVVANDPEEPLEVKVENPADDATNDVCENVEKIDNEPISTKAETKQKANNEVVDTSAAKLSTSKENKDVSNNSEYPKYVRLNKPITIYRAPNGSFAGRSFGGALTLVGPDRDGFTPVKFNLNRGNVGIQIGYVRTSELSNN